MCCEVHTVRSGVRDLASLAVGLLYDTALDGDVFSSASLDVMLRLLYVDRLLATPVVDILPI